jgi:hypothetical protein
MNQKRAKLLRRQAKDETVGKPDRTYRGVVNHPHECTRGVYRAKKRTSTNTSYAKDRSAAAFRFSTEAELLRTIPDV